MGTLKMPKASSLAKLALKIFSDKRAFVKTENVKTNFLV